MKANPRHGLAIAAALLATAGCTPTGDAERVATIVPGKTAMHQVGQYCPSDKSMVAAPGEKGHLAFGPYASLEPGRYRAVFDVAVEGVRDSAGRVDVNGFLPTDQKYVVSSYELEEDGRKERITLDFDADRERKYEFRVTSDGTATVRLFGVTVDRLR